MEAKHARATSSRARHQNWVWAMGLVLANGACAIDSRSVSTLAIEEEGVGGLSGEALGRAQDGARAGAPAETTSVPVVQAPVGAPPGPLTAVGSPCTSDTDCVPAGMQSSRAHCILSTSSGELGEGGPQGGYCSAPCQDDGDCQNLDGAAACNEYGFCVRRCEHGVSGLKCDASRAQACAESAEPRVGACVPVCQSDAACGGGRFCEQQASGAALCGAVRSVGGNIGAPCSELTAARDCASGICVTYPGESREGAARTYCSAFCTLGLVAGCGFDQVSAVPREAACLRPERDGAVEGDLGLCEELCDIDADCSQAGWICTLYGAPGAAVPFGRTGRCRPF